MSSPLLRVVDGRGRPTRWVLVRAPVASRAHHRRLADLADAGCRFAGMASYLGFPGAGHRDPRDYGALCEGWFHCFRDPDRYLPATGPRALLSESDFTDPRQVDPDRLAPPGLAPADVVYVCARPRWKRAAKNWRLAQPCLRRLAGEAGLRALVVAAPPEYRPPPGVRAVGELPWRELLAVLAPSRLLFVPNLLDASPRVLAEALCLDVPVLVNRAILGGWKYVNAFTGEFFDGPADVVAAAGRVLARARCPRRWFAGHHGPGHAGARMAGFLRTLDPELPRLSHVRLAPAGPAAPVTR